MGDLYNIRVSECKKPRSSVFHNPDGVVIRVCDEDPDDSATVLAERNAVWLVEARSSTDAVAEAPHSSVARDQRGCTAPAAARLAKQSSVCADILRAG